MRVRREHGAILAYLVFIALAGAVIALAWDLPQGGAIMPVFAAAGVAVFSLAQIVRLLAWPETADAAARRYLAFDAEGLRPLVVAAATALYIPLIFGIGYFTATTVYLVAVCLYLGVTSWRAIAVAVVILLPLMYAFFVELLATHLPRGIAI